MNIASAYSVAERRALAEETVEWRAEFEPVNEANGNWTSPIRSHSAPLLPSSRIAVMAVADAFGYLVPIVSATDLLSE